MMWTIRKNIALYTVSHIGWNPPLNTDTEKILGTMPGKPNKLLRMMILLHPMGLVSDFHAYYDREAIPRNTHPNGLGPSGPGLSL